MSTLTTNYLTPTGREEAWRFTPLKRLGGLHDGTAVIADRNSRSLKGAAAAGVIFERISRELAAPLTESDDVIVARIRENAADVAVLTVKANTEVAEPIFLTRSSGALDSAELSRVQIRIENHAKATVIIENSGDTHLAEDLEISVAPGANLTLVTLQEWDSKTIHTGRHHAIVDRDATFKSIVVTVGGSLVRLLPTVDFVAPGASCELLGVYFATSGQFFEH